MGEREWLEPNGLGGFASGTVGGERTRRYHALLLADGGTGGGAERERLVLVDGLEVQVETSAGRWWLSRQRYFPPGEADGPGHGSLEAFEPEPWPRWTYRLADGTVLVHELTARHGTDQVVLSWSVVAGGPAALAARLFVSGRSYHALHHENGSLRMEPLVSEPGRLHLRTYDGLPTVGFWHNGVYRHDPHWYRSFDYVEEQARGLDHLGDLASPGVLQFQLAPGRDALLLLGVLDGTDPPPLGGHGSALRSHGTVAADALDADALDAEVRALRRCEAERRGRLGPALHRAADSYLVRRGGRPTILAGYPWFTDWGRDTFIALRGLCVATGRLDDALAILLRWTEWLSEGLLPNRIPDHGATPEYNSVDAALWYVVAVYETACALALRDGVGPPRCPAPLVDAVEQILTGYLRGTRHRVGATGDGLLAAGTHGLQLTWMDAKVGDWVVTPRIGKPVEVQALWLNALWVGAALETPSRPRWQELYDRGRRTFQQRFWNPRAGALYDVVDEDRVAGRVDPRLRPNQLLAVAGLPVALVDGARARSIVELVERELVTPGGLRTLGPGEEGYRGRYEGDMWARDGAYHQGTVWPWLLAPFVEAWVAVRGSTADAERASWQEADRRFIAPLRERVGCLGVGHLPELFDGDPPHLPRGCPFQAWSLAALLWLEHLRRRSAEGARSG
jgi:glycogen debranching enzyme